MTETTSTRGRRLAAALAVLAAALAPAPGSAQTTCPAFTAPMGYTASGTCGPNAPVGTLCPVTCNSTAGYIGTATDPVCRSDGTWSSPVGCALKICAAPAAPTGYSVSCSRHDLGEHLQHRVQRRDRLHRDPQLLERDLPHQRVVGGVLEPLRLPGRQLRRVLLAHRLRHHLLGHDVRQHVRALVRRGPRVRRSADFHALGLPARPAMVGRSR